MPDAVDAVLEAADHDVLRPGGQDLLTQREVEVLRLAAQGLTIKGMAARLSISQRQLIDTSRTSTPKSACPRELLRPSMPWSTVSSEWEDLPMRGRPRHPYGGATA